MHSVPPQPGLPLTPQHLARHLACPRHQNMLIDCSQSTSLSPPPPPPKCTRRKSLPVFPLPCMIFSHLLSSTSLSSHNPAAAFSPHPVHSVLSPVFSESIPPAARLHPTCPCLGLRLLCLSPKLWPHLLLSISAFQPVFPSLSFLYLCQMNLSTEHIETCHLPKFPSV